MAERLVNRPGTGIGVEGTPDTKPGSPKPGSTWYRDRQARLRREAINAKSAATRAANKKLRVDQASRASKVINKAAAIQAGKTAFQRAITEFPFLLPVLGFAGAAAVIGKLLGPLQLLLPSRELGTEDTLDGKSDMPNTVEEGKTIEELMIAVEDLDNVLPPERQLDIENRRLNTRVNPYAPEARGPSPVQAPAAQRVPSSGNEVIDAQDMIGMQNQTRPVTPGVSQGNPRVPLRVPSTDWSVHGDTDSVGYRGDPGLRSQLGQMLGVQSPSGAPAPAPSVPRPRAKPTPPTGPMADPGAQNITAAAPTRAPITATGPGYAGGYAGNVAGTDAGAQGQDPRYQVFDKDSTNARDFRAAFAAARKAGKKVFEWHGRMYTTKLASDNPSTTATAQGRAQ